LKIEYFIVQHLYSNKEVSLQGIGTFRLDPHVVIPSGAEKDFVMPENAIKFQYNLKATEDESLINYIVQQTRKIKPLATSDLDSYCMLAKQFLNIGKPLLIEGIGTVQKNQQGEYEFIQGNFIGPKVDDSPKQLKEKKEEAVSFASESKGSRGKNNIAVAVSLLVLVLVALTAYYFLVKRKHPEPVVEQVPIVQPITDTAKKDTIAKPIAVDSNLLKQSIVPKDSFSFKVVIKEYTDSNAANAAYERLTKYGRKMLLYKTDSTYKLAIPFMTPLSDTARARDSLHKFFAAQTKVEL
jgi:hypothetical protein